MNEVALILLVLGICMLLYLLWPGGFVAGGSPRYSRAERRAAELLRALLTPEQYAQLSERGYIEIPSPAFPQRVYRVPRNAGLVHVFENEKLACSLCLQPLDWIPDADIVIIHKLMIEADEGTYLRRANRIAPPPTAR
jgi:hypothetical protein